MQSKSSPLYMGVDIQYGSPQARGGARYYVVVVDSRGILVDKASDASIARVIRLAWNYRPKAIGVDNIYELASDARDLARIVSLLPPETEIIQVNVDHDQTLPLQRIARDAGFEITSKPSPGRTAYIAAVLASQGYGQPVRLVEEKTLIIVSKGRSSGKGGWSQQRYQRRLRAGVHQAAMRIKELLDNAGLEYDYRYRKSEGGLESAVFTVYAERSKLKGIVRNHSGPDYTVTVKPVYKSKIILGKTGERPQRPVIVGFDPGISSGIAIIDLKGEILYVDSFKSLDRGSMLDIILRYGKPIIIAVDVKDIPDSVRKLAAQIGAHIFTPDSDISTVEKRELSLKALKGKMPKDSHQRDALAAAYKAYTFMRSKLDHIDSYLARLGIGLDPESVKVEVLKGKSIAEAIEKEIERRLGEKDRLKGAERARERNTSSHATNVSERGELKLQIEALKAEKRMLEERIQRLERELEKERINARITISSIKKEAYKDSELRAYRDRIEALEKELETLKRKLEDEARNRDSIKRILYKVYIGDTLMARAINTLTKRSLNKSITEIGPLRPGEIVVVRDPNVFDRESIRILRDSNIYGVVIEGRDRGSLGNALENVGIPVVILNGDQSIARIDSLVILKSQIRDLIADRANYLEERRTSSFNLEKIINEYRRKRLQARDRQRHPNTHKA
ncbi:MAG: DUF460 domain-containing protein [Desulfurococcales archaeon]|nr:DUF460 domain-containing protein [Desulfurococcales archaeon]